MIKLTINGQEITADPSQTILQVCRDQKIDNIPTLCYDDRLPAFGSCFLCVVEMEGTDRLFPSCSTKVAEGMKIQTRSEKIKASRKTCLELLLSDHYADCFGPCRLACPADVDIQGYMSLIHLGKFNEAVALIKDKNPLPSVCGRVCTRKCEVNCRRSMADGAVGIDFLKRYAADQDMIGEMWTPETKPDNGVPIAIIGGGPAGLTAAYYLVLDGYRPTVFEALPKLGGMLRYGIPEYRLPKSVLQKEIDWIANLGVDIKTNTMLGRDITLDSLFKDGYKAVFVGLGAQIGKPMRVTNEEAEGVLSGVEFLKQVEMGTNPKVNGHVVVVGGGNTAIDAARTSLRLGADKVSLFYRRTRKEMPANDVEIDAAIEEGVDIQFLVAPSEVHVDEQGRAKSLFCSRMELGEPDESGRRRPQIIEGSEFDAACDWIISAIGQEPELSGLEKDEKLNITRWNTIEAAAGTFATDRPGVFTGGDVQTGPADAIDAIAAGRAAALAIDRYVQTGKATPVDGRFESRRDNLKKVTPDDLPDLYKEHRHQMPEMPIQERIHTFKEVELGLGEQDAREEALRCAECGCDVGLACTLQDFCTEYGVDQTRFVGEFNRYKPDTRHPFIKLDANKCIRCGRCVSVCSEILNVSALGFVNRGFRTVVKPALDKSLQETNCVSCGNCIDVCPTGAIVEKMPFRRSGPWEMESVFNVCNFCSVGCNLTIKKKTDDIFFIAGAAPDMSPNFGELCIKGRFGYQQYLDGSRVKSPMIRKGGDLVQCSWEEAFDAVETGLARIREQHDNNAILVSASPKLTNEELYLAGRMARAALNTNNLTSFQQMIDESDHRALDPILGSTVSTVGMDEVNSADLFLFVGGHPTKENPVLGWQMKRRMKQGTEAVVINSRGIDLVDYATAWADARRGTSTLVLNGVISACIDKGYLDEEFIASHTSGAAEIIENFRGLDLDEIASVSGVSRERMLEIADLLGTGKKKIVAWYNLDSRTDRSTNDLQALSTLMLLLGKFGNGSGLALLSSQCNHYGMKLAGFDQFLMPGLSNASDQSAAHRTGVIWQTDLEALIASDGQPVARSMRADRIRAAFVLGENPGRAERLNKFVDNLEFLVVGDLFMTETAQRADVFLPLSMYLETDGHLTNWEGKEHPVKPLGLPSNGLSNSDIIKRLAEIAGGPIHLNTRQEVTDELHMLIKSAAEKRTGMFHTEDGKARFVPYSHRMQQFSALVDEVIEADARMTSRMGGIKA